MQSHVFLKFELEYVCIYNSQLTETEHCQYISYEEVKKLVRVSKSYIQNAEIKKWDFVDQTNLDESWYSTGHLVTKVTLCQMNDRVPLIFLHRKSELSEMTRVRMGPALPLYGILFLFRAL